MSCTVEACRICLATTTKLYDYNQYELKLYYEQLMASNVKENDGLPCYFCYECAAMLHKFHKFKEKCYIGQKLLKKLIWKEPITLKSVCSIKIQTKSLQSSLNIITASPKVKTLRMKHRILAKAPFEIKEPFEILEETAPVSDNDDFDDMEELPPLPELVTVVKNIVNVEEDEKKIDVPEAEVNVIKTKTNINEEKTDEDENIVPTEHFLEDTDKDFSDDDRVLSEYNKDGHDVKKPVDEEEYIPEKRKKRNTKSSNKKKSKSKKDAEEQKRFKKNSAVIGKRKFDLDPNNWLKMNLTEEQALEEFKSRALQKRYIAAPFRCDLCLKGFSKEDMLHRHNKLRHAESVGPIECRFCHMRFKWKCFLSRHMRQHFTKYQCLRCDLVCPLETTAQFHEEYHNGVIRKCGHCGEEFKHLTTYYTHLRTHRSEHVCPLCGASFVSKIGLKIHAKIKHLKTDTTEPEEASEEQEFCKRCNIKFETKKAYDEHFIHSAMHVDGIEDLEVESPILSNPRKVRQNVKRHQRIPTDCYICGKHFSTQSAARKHHLAEHPRASFFAPNERHICEICGASLAPGSVNSHLNTHTREKKFACSTCGRQFISKGGLTMHQLTHTSEKPVPCTLCDKRFKQAGSMKLHYRTFHLKEPYPKRNRNKKTDDISKLEQYSHDGSDDNITMDIFRR